MWPGDSVSPFTTGFTLKVGGQDVVGSIIEPTAGVRFCSLSLKGEKWSKGDRPHQDASFSKECVSPPKVPLPLGRHLPDKAASGEIKGSLRNGRNPGEETQPTQKGQGLPGEATLGAGALFF